MTSAGFLRPVAGVSPDPVEPAVYFCSGAAGRWDGSSPPCLRTHSTTASRILIPVSSTGASGALKYFSRWSPT